jgi:hypothetical protein
MNDALRLVLDGAVDEELDVAAKSDASRNGTPVDVVQ